MTYRAETSGCSLSSADAAIVKGMLLRGDRQHDIAAYFGVNGGRIGEIARRNKFVSIPVAPANCLPSAGPYINGKSSYAVRDALHKAKEMNAKGDVSAVGQILDETLSLI